jgi:hypothetical protein
LGTAPHWIIVKGIDLAEEWETYHYAMGNNISIKLNNTSTGDTGSGRWNSTTPTSSVFSVGNANATNQDGKNFIAYCFAKKTGYNKFGKYTGNGNVNGTFVYTGFKPSFLIIKNTAVTEHWVMHDNKRPGFNGNGYYLYPNLSNAEVANNTTHTVDLLSNGFKVRSDNDQWNDVETMMYIAFGQSLVGSNNVPCTAR